MSFLARRLLAPIASCAVLNTNVEWLLYEAFDFELRQPRKPAWEVPVALVEEAHRGRNDDGAHERRVDEQRDGDAEPHLLEGDEVGGRNTGEDGHDDQGGPGDQAGGGADAAPGANREAVLRVVGEQPGITARELAAASQVTGGTLYTILRRLVQEGTLEKRELPGGQTGYAIAASAASAPQPATTTGPDTTNERA